MAFHYDGKLFENRTLSESFIHWSDEKQWPEPVLMTNFECQQMSSELFAKLGTMVVLYKDTKKHMDKINAYKQDIKQCIINILHRVEKYDGALDLTILKENLNVLLKHVNKTFK